MRIIPVSFFFGLACWAMGEAQTLPTGVTAVPFYDTSKAGLSFKKDRLSTMGIYEVPGKPRHFFVLGYWGFVWSLYPDTNRPDTVMPYGPVKHYTRRQIANFNNMVMKGWEQGALGAAFDPGFLQGRRYFYIIYNKYANPSSYHTGTTPNGNDGPGNAGLVVVERWTVSANYQNLTRDTTILSMNHGTGYGSSNMVFGRDGFLYISTDSYSHNSWDSTTFMRKVLRIDVTRQDPGKLYAIPPANPWFQAANPAVKKEVYAFGFRNTFSIVANYVTGSILGAEVGQSTWEEVNVILPGRNYGWGNGGDGQPAGNGGTYGVGAEGPCSNNTSGGGAYNNGFKNPYSYTGPVSFGQTMDCSKFTNGAWSFSHSGSPVGGIASSLPGTQMACIIMGPAFRGDPASPFYGYHFVTDVARNYFIAVKEGVAAPRMVGGIPAAGGIDPTHNGIVAFGEDSYGNQYAVQVSSTASGDFAWHDILRLSHPQLTPLAVPRTQVFPTAISERRAQGRPRYFSAAAGIRLKIPDGHAGVELHNLLGKKIWTYRGNERWVEVPAGLETGILQARFLR